MSGNEEEEELLVETDKCKLFKKEDRIIAKCQGGAELDLGALSEAEIQENVEKKEDCPECAGAVAAGWALSYVKPLEPVEADALHQKLLNNEISTDEALDKSKEIAERHKDAALVDTIIVLKEMAHKPLSEIEKMAEET